MFLLMSDSCGRVYMREPVPTFIGIFAFSMVGGSPCIPPPPFKFAFICIFIFIFAFPLPSKPLILKADVFPVLALLALLFELKLPLFPNKPACTALGVWGDPVLVYCHGGVPLDIVGSL